MSNKSIALHCVAAIMFAIVVLCVYKGFERPTVVLKEVPVPIQSPPITKIVKVPVKLTQNDHTQIKCLAINTYYEAGNQPKTGMIAVSNVVMNRVKHRNKTPCAVIYERGQFSWTTHRLHRLDAKLLAKTTEVAENVYLNNYGDVTHGAEYYHASYVHPNWSHRFVLTTQIGEHMFYRVA
jgi:spore germination cell wall hydrolase CwlJ-like protein